MERIIAKGLIYINIQIWHFIGAVRESRSSMFKNYFKTAWRNLLKNKFYSLINIAGLTAGLAVGILILLWVQDELSFDGFHKKTADIYRLECFWGTGRVSRSGRNW